MVSCVVLTYNGEKLLKTCLESLQKLTYNDKEIIVIDNHSTDNSVKEVRRHFPQIKVIANTHNSGYSGGANQAVELSRGEYVMILNPDIVFEPDYLDVLVKHLEKDKKIGAIIGKLRKYDFGLHSIAHAGDMTPQRQKTNTIDSAGLLMFKNRRCVDRGQGEEDEGQYDTAQEVFGITGACPLYRREALEDAKIDGQVFDEDFFMYKEDVDLSWRLRLFGWKNFYEPQAIAYHGRGTGAVNRSTLGQVAGQRKNLSVFQKSLSYKNERLMRAKNELWPLFWRDFFHIAFKEILMFGWMIVREPFLFKFLGKLIKQLPRALKKRRQIMKHTVVSASQIGKWFV